jgi:hypothetical protein
LSIPSQSYHFPLISGLLIIMLTECSRPPQFSPVFFLRTFTKNKGIINTQNYNDRTHFIFIKFFRRKWQSYFSDFFLQLQHISATYMTHP